MQRRRSLLAVLTAALVAALGAEAAAQPAPKPSAKPREEAPYKPVAVSVAAAPTDPAFAALRQQLAGAAKNRVFAELDRLVVPRGFFLEGGGALNPSASGAENLATAIRLESEGGTGWRALAAFAAAPGAAPLPSRPEVLCVPALPQYDPVEFDQLLAATGTQAGAWRYPRDVSLPMRAGPRPTGRAVDTLGPHLVRVLADPDPTNPAWTLVAAPSGKTGFVPAAVLLPLRSDRLCFHRDVTGRWQIAGFIAAARRTRPPAPR